MQEWCPQWEIISLLNSQAAFPSVSSDSGDSSHLRISTWQANSSCWLWKLEGQVFRCQEGQIALGIAFSGLVSADVKGQSPWSLGTLCSISLPCSLYTQQTTTNSIIINQLVIFKATYAHPSLGFRIFCLCFLQVSSWRQPQGCCQEGS